MPNMPLLVTTIITVGPFIAACSNDDRTVPDGLEDVGMPLASGENGVITVGGSPVKVTIATPGQNARYTFKGSRGQVISVTSTKTSASDSLTKCFDIRLLKPDGSRLKSEFGCTKAMLDAIALPDDGSYSVLFDPA